MVRDAFDAGCAAFSCGGFRFGDPSEFLHPAGHPHWHQPDFRSCPHCTPAVQGRVVLLHTKRDGRGEVEEVYMYGADSRMPRSKTKLQ